MNLKDLSGKQLLNEYNTFHSNFLLAGTDSKEMYETKDELLSKLEKGEKAIELVDGCKNIVEMFGQTPAQYKWRAGWLNKAREVLK